MGMHIGDSCLLFYLSMMLYTVSEISEKPGYLNCFVNFVNKMYCTWYKEDGFGDGPFSLLVNSNIEEVFECSLIARPDVENSYNCTITTVDFSIIDIYEIFLQFPTTVNGSIGKKLLIEEFYPCSNIKCDPPYNLKSNVTNNSYKLQWEVHTFIKDKLRYELQFKKQIKSWQKATQKQLNSSDMYVEIDVSEFEANSVYVVRLRCKTNEAAEDYISQWSEWSSELLLQTLSKGQDENEANITHHVTFLLVTLIPALIILYLFFSFKVVARVKVSLLKNVPTAAEFFQPLYHVHNGNFQDWIKFRQNNGNDKDNTSRDLNILNVLNFQVESISHLEFVSPLSSEEDIDITQERAEDEDYPSLLPKFDSYGNNLNNALNDLHFMETNYVPYEHNSVTERF